MKNLGDRIDKRIQDDHLDNGGRARIHDRIDTRLETCMDFRIEVRIDERTKGP